jgi:hypothetical protein
MRGMVQNFIYLDDVPVDAVNLLGSVGAGMEAATDAMLYTRLAIGAMCVGGLNVRDCASSGIRSTIAHSIKSIASCCCLGAIALQPDT